jgi:DNA-binding NtrC family response regulator
VLVRGESGSGKELVARMLHERSGRRGAFVAVNCGALVETLAQSELFGHKKGAFSGADADTVGLVRSAGGGTLFLDEIGDLPAASQAVLLRVLQEKEVKPVGAVQPLPIDLRVVAATHRDLQQMIAAGAFRADLYARLAGFELTLPPLRDRPEDVGLLIAELLARHGAPPATTFECDAARALLCHDWPLNVRELEQCLASALVLATPRPIALEHLAPPVRAAFKAAAAAERPAAQLDPEEQRLKDELVAQLARHHGNVSAVARELGKDRKQIHRWLRRFQILRE